MFSPEIHNNILHSIPEDIFFFFFCSRGYHYDKKFLKPIICPGECILTKDWNEAKEYTFVYKNHQCFCDDKYFSVYQDGDFSKILRKQIVYSARY